MSGIREMHREKLLKRLIMMVSHRWDTIGSNYIFFSKYLGSIHHRH
jgi:hypothetical protein